MGGIKDNYKHMKTVIFDLFGTLTDGVSDPEARIIEFYKLPLDYNSVEKFVCGTKFVDRESQIKKIMTK